MKAIRLLIAGRVQGVYYRKSAQAEANQLGVKGWVRNLPDGQVEAWAEGEEEVVASFVAWCHEGPAAARVDHVQTASVEPEGFSSFEVLR